MESQSEIFARHGKVLVRLLEFPSSSFTIYGGLPLGIFARLE